MGHSRREVPPPASVLRLSLLRALSSAQAPAPPYSPATAVTAAAQAPAPPYSPAIAVTAAGALAVAGAYRLCRCFCVVSAPTSVPGPAVASVFDEPRTQGALSPPRAPQNKACGRYNMKMPLFCSNNRGQTQAASLGPGPNVPPAPPTERERQSEGCRARPFGSPCTAHRAGTAGAGESKGSRICRAMYGRTKSVRGGSRLCGQLHNDLQCQLARKVSPL